MARITVADNFLTVLNLFETETQDGQDRLLEEMRSIIDSANYEGWISSTLLGGVDQRGTANYIQWRSLEDLQQRYATETFRHETVPLFNELSTSIRLLKTEVVFTRQRSTVQEIEISPAGNEHTVIIVMGVDPDRQKEVVELFAQHDEWLETVPGYVSNSILRGIDGTDVVNFAQWESKETYDAFHSLPEEDRPNEVREVRARIRELLTARSANSYRVVHTRSAED